VGVARGAGAKGAGCQSGPPRTGGVVGGVLTRSWNPVRVATDFAGDGAWFSFSSGAAGLGSGRWSLEGGGICYSAPPAVRDDIPTFRCWSCSLQSCSALRISTHQ